MLLVLSLGALVERDLPTFVEPLNVPILAECAQGGLHYRSTTSIVGLQTDAVHERTLGEFEE